MKTSRLSDEEDPWSKESEQNNASRWRSEKSAHSRMKPSRLSDEAGTKAETSEQNTSRLSDEEGPYAKERQ